jgi:ketosteroid isomerase-like protein
MSNEAKSVAEQLYVAWKVRDLPSVLALLSDDVVFALHIPASVLPVGGETKGKPAVAAALQTFLDTYEFLAYEPGPVTVDGERANAEVHFRYRQRATGEVIDSRLLHSWVVEAGKVTRLDEWHDLPGVRAFFDRVAFRSASGSARR